MREMKNYLRIMLMAMLSSAIVLSASSCFKELDPSINDPSSSGSSTGSGNSLNSGLVAYYSFDDGTGVDGTTNHVDGILLNGVTTTDGISGTGVRLNAFQNQYFNIPYNLFHGLKKFSVSFWIRDFGPGCIFAAQNTNNSSEYYDIPFFYASQNGKFTIKGNGGYEAYSTQFSYDYQRQGIQSNAWHHLVVTMNEGTTKLFIDGSLVDQATISYYSSDNASCSKVVFGGDKEGGYATKSSMELDEINIYNRELTANEVRGLYNLNY